VRDSVDGMCRPVKPVAMRQASESSTTSEWSERCAPHQAKAVRALRPIDWGDVMGDKSPKKTNAKKPSKSLKEKRADKQSKREDKRPGFGH
jgi:hypothetical protein